MPTHLDQTRHFDQHFHSHPADARGVDLADLVNEMLRKDIELIEMAR